MLCQIPIEPGDTIEPLSIWDERRLKPISYQCNDLHDGQAKRLLASQQVFGHVSAKIRGIVRIDGYEQTRLQHLLQRMNVQ